MDRRNVCVGDIHHGGTYSLVPIPLAVVERQKLDLKGELWLAVLDTTCQNDYFCPAK